MVDQYAIFSIGDHIQVSSQCFSESLRGAFGVISRPPANVVANDNSWNSYWKLSSAGNPKNVSRIYWVEFNPIIPGDDPTHPIEAAEIDETDLIRYSE